MLVPVLLGLLVASCGSSSADEDIIVKTPLGELRGTTSSSTSRSGRKFYAFTGIGYAKPPVGNLRFQAPEPIDKWEGIKDAKKDGPECPMYFAGKTMGNEDCLYLSVVTPNISGKFPVLVQTHGGGYSMGDASWYGPEFLMDEDVVVVRVNYRLGIFGFLTLESRELPGNQGVKDQVEALRWVQKNIASFGGNPNLVTIIGESAGGSSVINHVISPLSKGLFHRAISESGSTYCIWGVSPPGYRRSTTEKLLRLLDCPTNATQAIPCISAKSTEQILSKFRVFADFQSGLIAFGPVVEAAGPNSFIVDPPGKWKHHQVPLLIGTTSAEGLVATSGMTKDFDFKAFSKYFNDQAPDFYGYSATASNPKEITKKIRDFYLKNEEITADDFGNVTKIFSDIYFTLGITEAADRHTENVYFYYFDFRLPVPGEDKRFAVGAMHTAEAGYIWNSKVTAFYPTLVDQRDIELSKKLVKAVTNFMRTGVPVIEGSNLEWPTWKSDQHNYIHIDTNGFHVEKGLLEDRVKFWKSINYRDKYSTNVVPSGSGHYRLSCCLFILSSGWLLLNHFI